MNPLKILVLISIFSCSLSAAESELSFYNRYRVEPHLASILDSHSDEIYQKLKQIDEGQKKWGTWTFDWLPDYYVKYGLTRIEGCNKILQSIVKNGLTKVTVPKKYLYHVKGRPTTLSNLNYAIIIKKVVAAKNPPPITADEFEQLRTVMRDTGYISMHGKLPKKGPNYIRTPDGMFCIIDTESRFDYKQPIKGFLRILRTHDLEKELSQEALILLFTELKDLLKNHPEKISSTIEEIQEYIKRNAPTHSREILTWVKQLFKHEASLKTQNHPLTRPTID